MYRGAVRILTVGNAKGGTGKTTAAYHVAAYAARQGVPVLAVDMDPQGSLSLWSGVRSDGSALADGLLSGSLVSAIEAGDRFPVIPSGRAMAADLAFAEGMAAGRDWGRLSRALAPLAGSYRLAVIDAPPSLGPLAFNAIRAAAGVLVPVESSVLALQGLAEYEAVLEGFGGSLLGVLPVRVSRTRHSAEAVDMMAGHFGAQLWPGIPEGVAVRDAAGAGVPAWELGRSKAGAALEDMARRVIDWAEL